MEYGQLKKYLEIVVDMEKNLELMQKIQVTIKARIATLGIKKNYPIPIKNNTHSSSLNPGSIIPGGIFLGLLINLIAYGTIGSLSYLLCFFLGFFMAFIIFVILLAIEQASQDNRNELIYRNELEKYNKQCQSDDLRVEQENIEKEFLMYELECLTERYQNSKKNLQQIYDMNIIFPKYRNLIAICSIHEYISSQRCFSLEGYEGAYNIYETEVRFDRVITQLDKVLSLLDKIKETQFTLYEVLTDNNGRYKNLIDNTYT